jgi:hypothetical protein
MVQKTIVLYYYVKMKMMGQDDYVIQKTFQVI